ncbi:MAG TPA: signal peptidase I [Candidatus Choladousia intestinigallinarum]|nr:signal peptidase I [Candidatus Choladousia intestinigallinarum]
MRKKRSIVREVISWIFYLAAVFLAAYLMVNYVAERTRVQGESMYDTLSDGDNLIVDKISYRFTSPKRYDIIVFPFQYQEDTYYIKRIIGLPGETVQIYDGDIYINGSRLEEDYGYEKIRNSGLASEPITLGEDEYFVLGDNRNNSSDSREPSVGNVTRDQIIGRAIFRIWPLNRLGLI